MMETIYVHNKREVARLLEAGQHERVAAAFEASAAAHDRWIKHHRDKHVHPETSDHDRPFHMRQAEVHTADAAHCRAEAARLRAS